MPNCDNKSNCKSCNVIDDCNCGLKDGFNNFIEDYIVTVNGKDILNLNLIFDKIISETKEIYGEVNDENLIKEFDFVFKLYLEQLKNELIEYNNKL